MRRFLFYFLDEYRLNFIFVKFFITLNCYRITTLNYYHAKSLKSNFLTPKSYSAPATVKFYTVSNFGRANKLGAESCKQADVKFYEQAATYKLEAGCQTFLSYCKI